MRHSLGALFVAAALLPGAAKAETVYTVSKIVILGNKSVTTDKLMAVVQEHPGSKVTVTDIIADRDAISKVLEDAHVGGSVKPSVRTVGAVSEIIFVIDDQGIETPVVTRVAPKLDAEIFIGNASIPSATLATASGIAPGDDLSNEKILAAEQAIVTAYKTAKLSVSVQISGENKTVAGGKIDVIWHIVETKTAAKKKATEDTGGTGEQDQ